MDGAWWKGHLPDVIEAIFGSLDANFKFLRAFGLEPYTHPQLSINLWDWQNPMH